MWKTLIYSLKNTFHKSFFTTLFFLSLSILFYSGTEINTIWLAQLRSSEFLESISSELVVGIIQDDDCQDVSSLHDDKADCLASSLSRR